MADDQKPTSWLHPALLAGVTAGVVYFLYQLGDMFSKIQSFEIYTTPPGIGELLKLLATVVVIVATAMGLDVKAAVKNVIGAFGMGDKLPVALLAAVLGAGVLVSGCASLRLADGSLNVPLLLTWAQNGIDADCAFAPTSAVCNLGTDAIATAKTKAPADVKRSLVDAETQYPVIAPYVDWLIRLL